MIPAAPLLIAVTTDRRALGPAPAASDRVRPARPEVYLKEAVLDAVRAAGGVPLLLPPGALSSDALALLLDRVHAVVITGGAFDIDPAWYGQARRHRVDRIEPGRTALELELARACVERGLPLLGLCGGLQAMVVAAGGTLLQDIGAQVPGALQHEQPTDPATAWHPVRLEPGRLRDALGPLVQVNSTHHQAVDDPGPYRVVGRAPDGVVEACELPGPAFVVGVQWHPELLEAAPIFDALIQAARNRDE